MCQIDLGSFTLGQNKHGDLEIGLKQAANIFGFGGDRGLEFTIGEGRFGTKARHGAIIGGERIGLDSGIGINEAEGANVGSVLSFGNNPAAATSNSAAGQFLSFLQRIGKFFTDFGKAHEAEQSVNSNNSETENFLSGSRTQNQKGALKLTQFEYVDHSDYYQDVAIADEAEQMRFNRMNELLPEDDSAQLRKNDAAVVAI